MDENDEAKAFSDPETRGRITSSAHESMYGPLGQVVAAFSSLESLLTVALWAWMGVPERIGDIIAAELSVAGRLRVAGSLAQLKFSGEKLSAVRSVIRDIEKVNERRNAVVHSHWGHSPHVDTAVVSRLRRGGETSFNTWTREELERLADDIGSAAFRLMQHVVTEERGGA